MKFISQRRIEILIILLLGLIPLLWFGQSQVILGHDAGLPLAPIPHFLDRLYTWTVRFGFGNDQTYALPGIFIHGLEAVVTYAGFGLQSMQKITFIFWFVLPGLSMYYLATKIEDKLKLKFFSLPVAIFYMINHFLLQGWFVAERTKFSVYAALPLMIALLLDWNEGKRKTLTTGILIALIFFLLNGLASLPLFGGVIISLLVFVIYYFIQEASGKRLLMLSKLFGTVLLFSALLHSYWLIPFGSSLKTSYSQSVDFFGGQDGILDWVKYVSENSSYSNLIRLQGVPEWYQNPSHPYANVFLHNPFLILISSLIPVAAFITLLLYKKKTERKILLFFAFLAVVSLVFVTGAHPPFGALYIMLMKYVPGFIAFRNPFYKFSPSLWLAYAVLLGFFVNFVAVKIAHKKPKAAYLFYLIFCCGIVLYSYPFLNGSFFDYIKGKQSNRVEVPQYIYDFGKWSGSATRGDKKTLMLPPPNTDGKVEQYAWGYWSLAPITTLLTDSPILNNSLYMSKDEDALLSKLYSMMEKNEEGWQNLAKILGIQSFILRNDFVWDNPNSPSVSPDRFKAALSSKNLGEVKTFGKWEVYDFYQSEGNFTNSDSYSYIGGDTNTFGKIVTLPNFNASQPEVLFKDDLPYKNIGLAPTNYYLDSMCITCNLQWKFINTLQYIPTITQGSVLYFYIQNQQLKQETQLKKKPIELSIFYSQKTLRDIMGIQKSLDSAEEDRIILRIINEATGTSEELTSTLINSKHSFTNDNLIDLLSYIRTQQVIIRQIIEKYPNYQPKLLGLANALQINWNLIDTRTWRTSTEEEKRLLVNSPEKNTYQVYYRPNDNIEIGESVDLGINADGKSTLVVNKYNGWYDLGSHNLEKGKNRVVLKQQKRNLIAGNKALDLKAIKDGCYYSQAVLSARNDIYKVSFNHLRKGKDDKFFVAFVPKGKSVMSAQSIDVLTSQLKSNSYETTYASPGNNGFHLVICNRESLEGYGKSDIEVRDLVMSKVAIPDIIFVSNKNNASGVSVMPVKRSNTQYVISPIHQDKKSILVMGQSYSDNWVTKPATTHIQVNGYANGWVIPSGTTKLTIEYRIQELFLYGCIISVTTFLASLVILVISRQKKAK